MISTSPALLCRPCRLAGPAHPAATASFSMPQGEIPRETDCLLEGTGFELSVPREIGFVSRLCRLLADLSCGELRAPISEAGCSTTDRPPRPSKTCRIRHGPGPGSLDSSLVIAGGRWIRTIGPPVIC